MSLKWDRKFLQLALTIAGWSKDPSTQVGCVVVGPDREIRSTGYNGLPRGCNDDAPGVNERPYKYFVYEHAERNSLANAARMGTPMQGCTLYVTSTPSKFGCCHDCCRMIIQCGIQRVVQEPMGGEAMVRWSESMTIGADLLNQAGVVLDHVSLE